MKILPKHLNIIKAIKEQIIKLTLNRRIWKIETTESERQIMN